MAFVKLDCGILDSTLWVDRAAREIFITSLLMADPFEVKEPMPTIQVRGLQPDTFVVPVGWYGFVAAAGPGIVQRCGMDKEVGIIALERLAQPESESRTPDHEGRRMVRVDGGYIILNYDKYRQKDHTGAERAKRYRERKMASRVTNGESRVTSRHVTQAEAESYSENTGATEGFEAFWKVYPKKRARRSAEDAWITLGCSTLSERIVSAVKSQLAAEEGSTRYWLEPANWLGGKRWEDEVGGGGVRSPEHHIPSTAELDAR